MRECDHSANRYAGTGKISFGVVKAAAMHTKKRKIKHLPQHSNVSFKHGYDDVVIEFDVIDDVMYCLFEPGQIAQNL